MNNEVLSQNNPIKTPTRGRRKSSPDAQSQVLDARRRLEERLEDMRLQKEINEFEFDFA